jgi:filamentous hemagglutinin
VSAGRDINVVTQTSASTNGSRLSECLAGLYVTGAGGSLLASAGRDVNLVASVLQSQGSASVQAAGSINLGAVTTGESLHFGATSEATFHQDLAQTTQTGSRIAGGGNVSLNAGQNISGTAAQINAQGDVALNAGADITLLAGQSTQSSDLGWTATDKGLLSSSSTTTRLQSSSATAIASSVQGNNVRISAGRNLTSVGSQFQAGGNLTVEGKNSQSFYEAQNTSFSQTETKSSSSLLGISLSDKTTLDSSLQTTAVATRLTSTDKIDIRVGNQATLQGAELQAKDIAFTQADPAKAGELLLGASLNTTQTAHTEKTETLGLWQEMKGNGSTTQTANLTTLKGNVSLDPGLKVTVQTGSANPSPADLQTQLQSLSSQPGLAYLKDLAANPNVKWEQIRLANEQWSYSQQGLTPAGAALLSIAVAAATGGMGAGLAGTTGTVASAAMNAGFSALASQAAVAMVNNGGDIGNPAWPGSASCKTTRPCKARSTGPRSKKSTRTGTTTNKA